MVKPLDIDGQIDKLCIFDGIAENASKSVDIDRRLGAFVLYAGFVDCLAIQAARLLEQIILKETAYRRGKRKLPTTFRYLLL